MLQYQAQDFNRHNLISEQIILPTDFVQMNFDSLRVQSNSSSIPEYDTSSIEEQMAKLEEELKEKKKLLEEQQALQEEQQRIADEIEAQRLLDEKRKEEEDEMFASFGIWEWL